jgi:hypothetical protein
MAIGDHHRAGTRAPLRLITNSNLSLHGGNDRNTCPSQIDNEHNGAGWHSGCGVGIHSLGGQTMGVISRCVATLRGEQCFITVNGQSEVMTYRRGQEIVAGDRSYVVTRILRGRTDRRVPSWEIWARPAKQ